MDEKRIEVKMLRTFLLGSPTIYFSVRIASLPMYKKTSAITTTTKRKTQTHLNLENKRWWTIILYS